MLKNIIIVNDFNYIQGGASKVAIDTAKLLQNEKLNIYFFSAVNNKESEIDGITYVTTNQKEALKEKNKLKGIVNGIYNLKAKKTLKDLLMKLDKSETIIHVHGWTKALSSSIFDIAFKLDFRVVLTLHDYFTACPNGGFFNYNSNNICKLKPLSWKCIKCNCDSRNYAFKLYRVIRQFMQNKIVKVPQKIKYVIGISDLNIEILKKTLNPQITIKKINNPIEYEDEDIKSDSSKNKYYLYVGRVTKEKGVEEFCKAITEAGVRGIVVGEGNERKKLEERYSNIEFTGWKNKDDVKKYMKHSRGLVFPSLWYEGAPLTPLEAMSYGIPCIINKKCAAKEYVVNNNGYLYENHEELVEDLKKLQNDEVCRKIGENAYIFFHEKYNKNYIQNLLEYYKDMENENE